MCINGFTRIQELEALALKYRVIDSAIQTGNAVFPRHVYHLL